MAHRLIQGAMGFGIGMGTRLVSAARGAPRAMGMAGGTARGRLRTLGALRGANRGAFGAAMGAGGGFVGTTALAGMGLGAVGNMGASYMTDPRTRNFRGMAGAGFRGAMFGGMAGAGLGVGGILAGGRNTMGGRTFRTMMGRSRAGLGIRNRARAGGVTLNDFTPI